MLIFKSVMVLFYILCRFLNCSGYHFQLSMLIVCVLHRYGSCVNPLGIACSQLHSNFMLLQLETLLIGLFISSVIKIHKIQRIHMVHITVHIYCLITCNIKSLLIVPKISHISRETCQVSRFPAKSSDSRHKLVFLPKQPLLELSAPVIFPSGEKKSFSQRGQYVAQYWSLHFNIAITFHSWLQEF